MARLIARPSLLAVTLGAAIVCAYGCGSSADSCELGTDQAVRVIGHCATAVTLRDHGDGYGSVAPPNSTCNGQQTLTLTFASAAFAWSVCVRATGAPWTLDIGTRMLNATEFDGAVQALEQLKAADGALRCASDLPTRTVEVTGGTKSTIYSDSENRCGKSGLYADNIDEALQALSMLAHN